MNMCIEREIGTRGRISIPQRFLKIAGLQVNDDIAICLVNPDTKQLVIKNLSHTTEEDDILAIRKLDDKYRFFCARFPKRFIMSLRGHDILVNPL